MARKTNAELQAEVDRLNLEVALLRAHKCPQPVVYVPNAPCTCTAWGPGTAMCPVHQPRGGGIIYTQFPPQGAADNGWQSVIVNMAGAQPPVFDIDPGRFTAGCAAPPLTQFFTVTAP